MIARAVSEGYRVGYLPRHHVKHWKRLEGCLGQIIEVYGEDADSPTKCRKHHRNSGVAVAALISGPFLAQPEKPSTPSKKHKSQTQEEYKEEKEEKSPHDNENEN